MLGAYPAWTIQAKILCLGTSCYCISMNTIGTHVLH
jgi:hypothetical protein